MIKIAIDISSIVYGTGVSVYTKELVKHLLTIDSKNHYILYGGSGRRKAELEAFYSDIKQENTSSKFFYLPPTIADILWNRLHMIDVQKLIGNVDVVHTSDWTEPPANTKKVTTVHDLTPILYPEQTVAKIVATHTRKLHWVKKESDAIIVPSESTQKDLISLGYDKQKIHVIPEAVSNEITKSKKTEYQKTLLKYGINSSFALIVGTAYRKNIERTIEAFEKSKADSGIKKLVIVGDAKKQSHRSIIYTGRITNQELSDLYSSATVFLYTSLYEGFGLPILEAFKCSVPVVTSNISSLPEVAGEAAITVDPTDVASITDGIIAAVKSREKLIKRGNDREKQFDWIEIAKRTHSVYMNTVL